ncbi:hypothetical protein K438DRAFT_1781997 [Mycena galopus ATCC 62051]|nr:hypothetical protein K438DRAFT_1781997 [Mycena galopus ATCC 62051]
MGPEFLGELDKPKKHAWVEEQIEQGTFCPDTTGIEAVAAGGMHSVFVDQKDMVSNSEMQFKSYFNVPRFHSSGRVVSMMMWAAQGREHQRGGDGVQRLASARARAAKCTLPPACRIRQSRAAPASAMGLLLHLLLLLLLRWRRRGSGGNLVRTRGEHTRSARWVIDINLRNDEDCSFFCDAGARGRGIAVERCAQRGSGSGGTDTLFPARGNAPQSDMPSPFSHGSQSRSFGQQSMTRSGDRLMVTPGGRCRARSDDTLLPPSAGLCWGGYDTFTVADDDAPSPELLPIGGPQSRPMNTILNEYDTFAVADDDAPLSELPPMGGPQPRRMNTLWGPGRPSELPLSLDGVLSAHWSAVPGSDESSVGFASPSLLSTDPGQKSDQGSFRYPRQLSPLSLVKPRLFSRSPGSDTSTVSSAFSSTSTVSSAISSISSIKSDASSSDTGGSPGPRNRRLRSNLHLPYPPLDEEPAFRERLFSRRYLPVSSL